jgi:hypothetical protein
MAPDKFETYEGLINAFHQEADKEHFKSRQKTLEPLFNTYTENHAQLWVEVHNFNYARYHTAYDSDAGKMCTTWLGTIPRVQMLEQLAWCIELGAYHIAASAKREYSAPSRRAWIPFHQKIEGSSDPTVMDLARNALSKKKEPCTVKTCNSYNDIVQLLNELGEDWKVYVPSELHGSASISAAWPGQEHNDAVLARLETLGCPNPAYALAGLCVPLAKALGKQIAHMVLNRKQMVDQAERPDPDPFTTMANDAHAGVLKRLVAMGPEAAVELLFAQQKSRNWAESSEVNADLVFGLPATTHRLKQAFAQPKLHSVVIYVVNYLFDQDELTPAQMAVMQPFEETAQHSIHALELVFDPDSKSIVFADPNGALIPGSNMEFVCVPAEKRDSPASTRHGCVSRWENHRWVVPVDGADGPRFDDSNAKLHKLVTKCRLSAGLMSAYYKNTPKSFLWQEPNRFSTASQKRAKDAGLLISSTKVQQAEYLNGLPAAAYVLDYPLLEPEEPSIPWFAEFAGQEDSRLVFAFFATHAAGQVNQGGSSWHFDTSCECKKVVIFNASTRFLLLDDAAQQLQNYSFEPWSVYHVERATKARVKSIVIQAHGESYPFIVLGYNDKPSAKLAAVGSGNGKRKKADVSKELARLQPAKVNENEKHDRKVLAENGSAQRKVAALIKRRASMYLTRGTGEKPNTKWHELVPTSSLLADKEAAGFFTGAFIPDENEANLESLVRLSMQLAEAFPDKVVNWTQHPVLGRYMKKMTIVVEGCGWAEQPAMHSKDEVVDDAEETHRRSTILYLPKDKYFGKTILKMVITAKNRIPTECWEQVVDKDVVIPSITLITLITLLITLITLLTLITLPNNTIIRQGVPRHPDLFDGLHALPR